MKNSRFQLTPTATSGFLSHTFHATRPSDPTRYILKVGTKNPVAQKFARTIRAFQRETAAYRLLQPLAGKWVPHCFESTSTKDGSDGLLLLREISSSRSGDQIRGLSFAELATTARSLGTIQSRFWNSRKCSTCKALPAHHYNRAHQTQSHLPAFRQECAFLLPSTVRKQLPQFCRQIARALRLARRRPATLIHGDLRADNLLFTGPRTQPKAWLIDWQLAGRGLGAFDLARLVGGSSRRPLSLLQTEKLVQIWHQSLRQGGVKGYSLPQAWQDYRTGVALTLSIPITNGPTLIRLSTRGKKIARLMVFRFFQSARLILGL